jgi:Heparinase II/III-like protein
VPNPGARTQAVPPERHLDLGSFVFDAAGIRWAADLGPDDYALPGYSDSGEEGERWKYFRLSNHSHSTLVLNGHRQNPLATTVICRKNLSLPTCFAIADLSGAYAGDAQSAHRRIALLDTRLLRWQMMTDANNALHGGKAVLTKNGRSLDASIHSPQGASFSTVSAHREKPENPIIGYQQLVLEHVERGVETRIAVQLSTKAMLGAVRPPSEW